MFQVASHPTTFDTPIYARQVQRKSISSSPAISMASVKLPRSLERPPYNEVSRSSITAMAPELANVPVEYIRSGLRPQANEMLAGIVALPPSHLPSSLPRSRLPASLTIPIRKGPNAMHPTHILAVYSSKQPTDQALLFPVHSLVIASQCSQLPRLPPSFEAHSTVLQLPVLPLSIPSPAAFSILHSFMYRHQLEKVLKGLLPTPSGFAQGLSHEAVLAAKGSGATLHQLSSYLCSSASGNPQVLMTYAAHAKELWQDMVALGLHDPELWDTLDLAWQIVLGALNLAAMSQ